MPTPRASTEEEAANLALSLLGQPGLATMQDANKRGREARKWFGAVRDALLTREDWNFADGEVKPAAEVTQSLGELKKRYLLPADCLQVRSVDELLQDEWKVVAGDTDAKVLVTNATAPVVRYTKMVTEVRLWSALFLITFAIDLAKRMAPKFGKSAAEVDAAAGELREAFGIAQRRDARERAPSQVTQDTSWISARHGWRR